MGTWKSLVIGSVMMAGNIRLLHAHTLIKVIFVILDNLR